MNLLFICSRNQWRSPTAEQLFRRHPHHQARSAGTSPNARRTVSAADIAWADHIFVMQEKHQSRLRAAFPRALQHKPLTILDIPDDYPYMDAQLPALLTDSLRDYLS